MVSLVPFLRHAKSLLCLHMASNPGINQDVRNYYINRLSAVTEESLKIDIPPENLGPLNALEVQ